MAISLSAIREAGFDIRRDVEGWKVFDAEGRPVTSGGLRREAMTKAAQLMAGQSSAAAAAVDHEPNA